MKTFGNSSLARALVFGLIVLAPASIAMAQGSGPGGEDQQGPVGKGQRFQSGNRTRQAPRASRGAPSRGQQAEPQGNQAFRPNFDNQGPSRRSPQMSGRASRPGQAMNDGNRNAATGANRRQPQPPPIVVYEFTDPESCAPCRKVAPIVEDLIGEGFPIRVVDLGKKPELAEKFHIESIPSFVRVEKGRETGRLEGAQTADDLAAFCDGEDFDDDENGDDDEVVENQPNQTAGPQYADRSRESGRGQIPNDGRRMEDDSRQFMNVQPRTGGSRGQVPGGRPTNANRGRAMDGRSANSQRMPMRTDARMKQGISPQFRAGDNSAMGNRGQAMNRRPLNLRPLQPMGKGRSMNVNPAPSMPPAMTGLSTADEAAIDLPDPAPADADATSRPSDSRLAAPPKKADSRKPAAARPAAALVSAGQSAFARSCTQCHDAQRSLSKQKDRSGWLGTVRRMAAKNGANVPRADWDAIATYLVSRNARASAAGSDIRGATSDNAGQAGSFSVAATISPLRRGANDQLENRGMPKNGDPQAFSKGSRPTTTGMRFNGNANRPVGDNLPNAG